MKRQVKYVLAGSAMLALLSACGGGGGGSSGGGFPLPVPAPAPAPAPAPVSPSDPAAPVAVLLKASSGTLGQVFTLDGSASTTASGKTRTYRWELKSRPVSSQAVLMDSGSAKPFFLLDIAGDYVVRLIVNDGEKDSDPVDSTISAMVPASTGPVLKFAIVETTVVPDTLPRLARYEACDAFRLDSHFADFWLPALSATNCNMGTGLPADFDTRYRTSSLLQVSGAGLPGALGDYTTLAAGVFPTDLPATPVSMSYEATANVVGLAHTPIGKTSGTSVTYAIPGYGMSYQAGGLGPKATYRIAGAVAPQNAPQGWEAVVETTVKIDVSAYSGITPTTTFNVYTKKFVADFSEDVNVELNPGAYPDFSGDQANYAVNVSHTVVYKRKGN